MKFKWLEDMLAAVPPDYKGSIQGKTPTETLIGPIPEGLLEMQRAREFAAEQINAAMKEHYEKEGQGVHDDAECARLRETRETTVRRERLVRQLIEEDLLSSFNLKEPVMMRTEGIVSVGAENDELLGVQIIRGEGLGSLAAVLAGISNEPRPSSRRPR